MARLLGKRLPVAGAVLMLGVCLVGVGSAATAAKPVNTQPPTVSGSAVQGAVLQGARGTWSGSPTDYNTWWQRCDKNGNSCKNISGTGGDSAYRLVSADVGHRMRFDVGAGNADGRTWAESVATAVVTGAVPANVQLPAISGAPRVGATLSSSRGTWTNEPTDYNAVWQRCDRNGGSCANISGTGGKYRYAVKAVDLGSTLRFAVGAANHTGRTWASSAPTAVISAVAPPPVSGCPGKGNADIGAISSPARLIIDAMAAPSIVTRQTRTLVVRFHVSSTCGGSVRGALVFVTATPYNQFSIPPEQMTGADGWVEVSMQRLAGFPISGRQQLIALFVRARKAGENLLGGISTRRLFSVHVNLHA
jgi:hypothetical protein